MTVEDKRDVARENFHEHCRGYDEMSQPVCWSRRCVTAWDTADCFAGCEVGVELLTRLQELEEQCPEEPAA